jgi:hypothetical protein
MKPAYHHKPTILDAMLMIGATAIGLGLARSAWPKAPDGLGDLGWFAVAAAYAMMAPWSLALLVIRLRRPRPPLRRLGRQPGCVACAITVLVIPLAIVGMLPILIWADWGPQLLFSSAVSPATPVAAAWVTLALAGRWHPEPSWIDRLGRAFGILWVVGIPITIIYAYYAILSITP